MPGYKSYYTRIRRITHKHQLRLPLLNDRSKKIPKITTIIQYCLGIFNQCNKLETNDM